MKNLLLAVLLLFLTSSAAQACSCVGEKLPQEQLVAKAHGQASLIFTGRVVSVEDVTITDTTHFRSPAAGADTVLISRRQARRYTFAVTETLKGTAGGPMVVVVTAGAGSSCGVSYAVGSERLVYAYTVDTTQDLTGVLKKIKPYFATGLCTRTQDLRATKASELRQLRQLARKG